MHRTQPTLDFVDVDVENDTKLFVSPRAIRLLESEWTDECVFLIQNFFTTVLSAIRDDRGDAAEALLRTLHEPNETRLGLSRGRAQGRALGRRSARDVWEALSQSEAARSGLLQDLEDTILMVDGISVDIVSDMTTNIIREPLIRYTQQMCEYHGIETIEVDSGPLWDSTGAVWRSRFERLPGARVLFLDSSCSGQAYFENGALVGSNSPIAFPPFARGWMVGLPGFTPTALWVATSVVPETIRPPIFLLSHTEGTCFQLNDPAQPIVVRATLLDADINATFPPPYSIEIRWTEDGKKSKPKK